MLSIVIREREGLPEFDLAKIDEEATVEDLFKPIQVAAEDRLLPKRDHPRRLASCAGCINNCCRRYRILPDHIFLSKALHLLGLDLASFGRTYLVLGDKDDFIEFNGRHCPFLQGNLCSVYAIRPAFCRFFLCVASSDRLEKLKGSVLLLAEMALKLRMIDAGLLPATQTETAGMEKNPWLKAEEYSQVRLRACCDDYLWEWLNMPPELAYLQDRRT
ncbi:MAG: YkgJ family cysteine cluster protein [Symbiobacteriaceae bacterium]|nr:YkgJ family cysteine cluster protein [Symbiobacteriaceae bacterium]